MARGNPKKTLEKKKLLEQGFRECYYCNEPVKPKALRCPHCGKWYSSGKQILAFSLVIIIALSLVSVYYLYPTGEQGAYVPSSEVPAVLSASPIGMSVSTSSKIVVTFNRDMDRDSVQSAFITSPNVPGVFSWNDRALTFTPTSLMNEGTIYTVTVGSTAIDTTGLHLDCDMYSWQFTTAGGSAITLRSIGTGENDFWSAAVTHPSWAINDVQTKPILILTHTQGCAPCETMMGICGEVSSVYSASITYYDLTSGTDEPQATDCFAAYDPVPPNYVPLTTILTKGPNNSIIWHSWEGVVDEATLTSWVDDAITYHEQ
ncbi:MAG: Ig-like domain-containing protein [Candidatus Thermoplasmatota archaeon]|nr:hypothetical protein [Euryarchaeota archaeon]MBU4071071.1 Ig-like domain-containing protein [Candidatus Thermoplasmatota archaeon]MBU4591141.1 Ig-like domain-containing protein [Candidatus Thermoplasmatota archaeon]